MKILKMLFAGTLVLVSLSGCNILNPADPMDSPDGSAGFVTSEVTSMGSAGENLLSPSELQKTVFAEAETMYVDIVINPWAYNTGSGYWTRSSTAEFNGKTRQRCDTVWLEDAAGNAVQTRSLLIVNGYRHVRSTTFAGDNSTVFRYDAQVRINKTSTDTTFVWNGTATGSFNGTQFRTTTITDVTRAFDRTKTPMLQFPSSGTIHVDRPLQTTDVIFSGNGSATATITRERDGEQKVYMINVQTGAETE
jgi:hypothetical protein